MLKGFLSGLAVSALALTALALAVPMTPDPAAGSPAPAPVLSPEASMPPAQTRPGISLAALPVAREALPVTAPRPAILPPTGPDERAFSNDPASLPRPMIDHGQAAPGAATAEAPQVSGLGTSRSAPATPGGQASAGQTFDPPGGVKPPVVLASFLAPRSPVWAVAPAVEPEPFAARTASPERPALVSGVDLRSDRLPQIGAPPPPAPQAERAPARVRHAMAVKRPDDGRPLLGVVVAYAGILPALPVTLALDPLSAEAAETARTWRDIGREMAILATGLPPGADARDIEVTLQSHLRNLPEAVALVDLPAGGIGRDRVLAAQTVAILAEDGQGLVIHATGLNVAARMAESADVVAVTAIERIIATDDATARRRALDRAALRAAQEGGALIFIEGSAEALETLRAWLDSNRGRELETVPLSILLNR